MLLGNLLSSLNNTGWPFFIVIKYSSTTVVLYLHSAFEFLGNLKSIDVWVPPPESDLTD